MTTVRLNITLPADIARQLDELVGPKRKSRFIADAIKGRLEQIQKEQLQKALAEGYKQASQENVAIASEFEIVDMEG